MPYASHQEWLATSPPLTTSMLLAKLVFGLALVACLIVAWRLTRPRPTKSFTRTGEECEIEEPLVDLPHVAPFLAFVACIVVGIYTDQVARYVPWLDLWSVVWWLRAAASVVLLWSMRGAAPYLARLHTSREFHDVRNAAAAALKTWAARVAEKQSELGLINGKIEQAKSEISLLERRAQAQRINDDMRGEADILLRQLARIRETLA